jgi:pimeloyl-ACP methyl ester carboxylesterase
MIVITNRVPDPTEMNETLETLVRRFDPRVLELGRREARVRLEGPGVGSWDALLRADGAELQEADGHAPDAIITADGRTWHALANDLSGGMDAFRSGRLMVRRDLHLGVGFLAATAAPEDDETRLRFTPVETEAGKISTMQAGAGTPVVLLHGLGATKASFLPTVAALAPHHRAIAIDLPGFGDSAKPLNAPYHAPYFAKAVVALLDALGLEHADVVGNSMGGRVAIELGLRHPERVGRMALLAPSLAWLRDRPWAPLLRLVPPQLGALQPAPRPVIEAIVRRAIPGAAEGWTAAGVDEFLRSYLTPAGRAAFYAAARNIYLEEPHGEKGFWTRLRELSVPALFVWGRRDQVVPLRFARHVRDALPSARHLALNCGHVPQLERPQPTHDAILRFLRG